MALKLSTCLRNKLLSGTVGRTVATYTATTIAAVDGGGSADTFTDSANGFVTAGFTIGDSILVIGFTGANAGSHGPFALTNVAAGTLTVATGSIIASDDAGESVTIVALQGNSLRDIFKDCTIKIYNGTQPTSPDSSLGGATCLAQITVSSGAFVSGAVGNGLEFGAASAGVLSKNTSETWSGTALVTGTATWFRIYANAADTGAADSTYIYPRIDGAIGTSGREVNMTSVYLTVGATTTVDTFAITLPEYYGG